jgi:hypothetical protein
MEKYFFRNWQPTIVRLGDQNLNDSVDDRAQPVEYEVKRFIPHPDYNLRTKQNDIALLELDRLVTFTAFIRPACLHRGNSDVKTVIAVWQRFTLQNLKANNSLQIFRRDGDKFILLALQLPMIF